MNCYFLFTISNQMNNVNSEGLAQTVAWLEFGLEFANIFEFEYFIINTGVG